MRQHQCRLDRNKDCACCCCRGRCDDDCDRAPTVSEMSELRRFLPLLRRLANELKLREAVKL